VTKAEADAIELRPGQVYRWRIPNSGMRFDCTTALLVSVSGPRNGEIVHAVLYNDDGAGRTRTHTYNGTFREHVMLFQGTEMICDA